jgi:hypothetical protein
VNEPFHQFQAIDPEDQDRSFDHNGCIPPLAACSRIRNL